MERNEKVRKEKWNERKEIYFSSHVFGRRMENKEKKKD